MSDSIQMEDHVLLVFDKKRRWLKKVVEKDFHCNYGMIHLQDLVGKHYGEKIETNTGKWLRIMPPSIMDWFDFFEHGSQIIYAKDAAMIVMLLDIKPGDIIFEAGTGSGALTSVLSRAVGESGMVITHEVRESAYKTAKRNHERLGTKNVEFILQDVAEIGFAQEIDGKELHADGLILDMGDPWTVMEHTKRVLKIGGRIVVFIPTYQQLEKMFPTLLEHNFKELKAIELLEREIQYKRNAIRPATRMIGHTGFLLSGIYLPMLDEELQT
ncbi:MAG: tRNA (adenine-N1)-methyltransferase [Candidatus Heimdallarchaeota archaeon]|nr:tRNA (adenine-N1)-methyltransferase [Candidatus Heimdallarchaeota archaeon]